MRPRLCRFVLPALACAGWAYGLDEGAAELLRVQIFEALAGANGRSKVQFLTFRLADPESARWGPPPEGGPSHAVLVFRDAAGTESGRFEFPSDAPLGTPDASGRYSVLVATREFAELPGASRPDFILPAGLLKAAGGQVCFRTRDGAPGPRASLCLSYGDFAGPTGDDGASPPYAAGPAAPALDTTGVEALKRHRHLDLDYFGARHDNADFKLEAPEARNSSGDTAKLAALPLVKAGENLFFEETFHGNGRTCFTCHKPEAAFSLPPSMVPPASGEPPGTGYIPLPPDDPLFVSERERGLAGLEDPEHLRGGRALILENIDGFERNPVFRGSPPLLNLKLTAPFGLSGETQSLREFTLTAVRQHFPRTLARNTDPRAGRLDIRLPTERELDALEAFMMSLELAPSLDLMLASAAYRFDNGPLLLLGKKSFFGKGKCFKCHNGPALAEVDESMVEAGLVPAPGNRSFNTGVAGPEPIPGTEPEQFRAFSTRPLVGAALRETFFHDNSARTLGEVLQFYFGGDDVRFGASPAGSLVGNLEVDSEALQAFLEALVEPAAECRTAPDCDADGINDFCELALDAGLDCNRNRRLDACDLADETSPDCNRNAVPDECEPPGVVELPTLNEDRSFEAGGLAAMGGLAAYSATGGDLNGDGLADLVVGSPQAAPAGAADAGTVHVLFGKSELGAEGGADLSALDGTNGFVIEGNQAGGGLGASVSASGDIDGDGAQDLLIGGGFGQWNAGQPPAAAAVVFGRRGLGTGGRLDLAALDGAAGFVVRDGRSPIQGRALTASGDLNGDRVADLIIGAPESGPSFHTGRVYVVFGRRGIGEGGVLDLSSLDGSNGYLLLDSGRYRFGMNVGSGGDWNGDGVDDLALEVWDDLDWQYVIIVRGSRDPSPAPVIDLGQASSSILLKVYNERFSGFGTSLSLAGDVNGDRLADLLVGAPWFTPIGGYYERFQAGGVYVVYGRAQAPPGIVSTYTLAEDGLGLAVEGARADDFLGAAASISGDVNRDGLSDLLAAGRGGAAGLVLGSREWNRAGPRPLNDLKGSDGVALRDVDPQGDSRLKSVEAAALGDFNGDRFADLALVIRPEPEEEAARPGKVRIFLGPVSGPDCNRNGIPDSCELADGTLSDFNGNGIADACETRFHRGDGDSSGAIDISDPIALFSSLFLDEQDLPCREAADANNDGAVDLTDGISLLAWLYLDGPSPAPPGPPGVPCGFDPDLPGSPGDLGCDAYRACR